MDLELEGRQAVVAALLPRLYQPDSSRDLVETDVGNALQAASFIVQFTKDKLNSYCVS